MCENCKWYTEPWGCPEDMDENENCRNYDDGETDWEAYHNWLTEMAEADDEASLAGYDSGLMD